MKPIYSLVNLSRLLCVMCLLLCSSAGAAEFRAGVQHVKAEEAHQLMTDDKSIQVLDVRTPKEYAQGHIKGAINIDYYADDFAEQLEALDPNTTYLVHCRSGVRSGRSLPILKAKGISHLIHLDGGIRAWNSADLPVVE